MREPAEKDSLVRLYQRIPRTTRCQHLWTAILPMALMSVLFLRLWSIIKDNLKTWNFHLKCQIIYWANNKLHHGDNSYNNKNLILTDQCGQNFTCKGSP